MLLDGEEYKEYSEYEKTFKLKKGVIKRFSKKLNLTYTVDGYMTDKEFKLYSEKKNDYRNEINEKKKKQMLSIDKQKKDGTWEGSKKEKEERLKLEKENETTPKKTTTK